MDPERPIEKLLRACARKRREEAGAPLELHPAGRKALQREIEQKFGKTRPSSQTFLQNLLVLWPRFAWGAAILAVLGLIAFMLVPTATKSSGDFSLAQNRVAPSQDRRQIAAAPVVPLADEARRSPTEQLAYNSESDKKLSEVNQPRAETPPSLPITAGEPISAPAPVLPRATKDLDIAKSSDPKAPKEASLSVEKVAPLQNYGGLAIAPAKAAAPSGSPTAPATALGGALPQPPPRDAAAELSRLSPAANGQVALSAAPKADSLGRTYDLKTDSLATDGAKREQPPAPVSQRFNQILKLTKAKSAVPENTPASAPVLVAFEVERTAGELRIIDTDGSVYSGYLLPTEAQPQAAAASRTAARARVGVNMVQPSQPNLDRTGSLQNYSFQVSGTNRSMNQEVVFSGTLATPALAFSGTLTNAVSKHFAESAISATNGYALPTSRISGRARIGTGKEIQIEAISAP